MSLWMGDYVENHMYGKFEMFLEWLCGLGGGCGEKTIVVQLCFCIQVDLFIYCFSFCLICPCGLPRDLCVNAVGS